MYGFKTNCHLERYRKRKEIIKKIRQNDYSSIDVDSKLKKAGKMKIGGEQLYYVRKYYWLNSKFKKENKLIRFKKGNEHIFFEIVLHVP